MIPIASGWLGVGRVKQDKREQKQYGFYFSG